MLRLRRPHRTDSRCPLCASTTHSGRTSPHAAGSPLAGMLASHYVDFLKTCVDPELLQQATANPCPPIVAAAAGNLHTPAEALERLAHHSDAKVAYHISRNPHTPAHIIESYAHSEDVARRGSVAANTSITEAVQRHLASDADTSVRMWLAQNPATTTPVLARLSLDKSDVVRTDVADHARLRREAWQGDNRAQAILSAARTGHIEDGIEATGCGITADNTEAVSYIEASGCDWWTLTPDSPEVIMALALSA